MMQILPSVNDLLYSTRHEPGNARRRSYQKWFVVKDVNSLKEKYGDKLSNVDESEKLLKKLGTKMTPEHEKVRVVSLLELTTLTRQQFVDKMDGFVERMADSRSDELANLRTNRIAECVHRSSTHTIQLKCVAQSPTTSRSCWPRPARLWQLAQRPTCRQV